VAATPSPVLAALAARVRARETGCLTAMYGATPPGVRPAKAGHRVRAWLVDGHLVAVAAEDDGPHVLARLVADGGVPARAGAELHDATEDRRAVAVSRLLARIAEASAPGVLDRALAERVGENLRRLALSAEPEWQRDAPPWAPFLVTGQECVGGKEPVRALQRADEEVAAGATLDDTATIEPGTTPPEDRRAREAVALAQSGARADALLAAASPEPLGARATLARWLAAGVLRVRTAAAPAAGAAPTLVSRDDLDAFSGVEDHHRGGSRGGTFVARQAHLDKVDITGVEGLDVRDAHAAPPLSPDEAAAKIDVANSVLRVVCAAFDAEQGAGAGLAAVQLLVEGRPAAFSPLFEGIRAVPPGALPVRDLLANLGRRSVGQQRHLLQKGLLDLLDRALDRAADQLSDGAFDGILEATVGFRQRMGL
jgi:hypothetical protein